MSHYVVLAVASALNVACNLVVDAFLQSSPELLPWSLVCFALAAVLHRRVPPMTKA